MPENSDYEDIVSGTVSEAKSDIEDLEDPDYRKLLQLEKEKKDRKTLKQWLEQKVDQEEVEVEEVESPVADEAVPETLSGKHMLAGGLIVGVLIGLVIGAFALSGNTQQVPASQVEGAVQAYADQVANSTPTVESAQVTSVTRRNGLYLVNITVTSTLANQTQESVASFYVTNNGRLMFSERSATNLELATQRLRQRQVQQPQNATQ